VVAVEAIVTYMVADWVGRRLQKWVPLDIALGRDRFVLILLASVFVRLAVEVWPGPDRLSAGGFDRADGWHSIGLVLVVGSFVASHATVRFGCDFGGISVCELLTIPWLDPVSVLATFAEVLVVAAIVRGLVAPPP
jgi:hypothetical protein